MMMVRLSEQRPCACSHDTAVRGLLWMLLLSVPERSWWWIVGECKLVIGNLHRLVGDNAITINSGRYGDGGQ